MFRYSDRSQIYSRARDRLSVAHLLLSLTSCQSRSTPSIVCFIVCSRFVTLSCQVRLWRVSLDNTNCIFILQYANANICNRYWYVIGMRLVLGYEQLVVSIDIPQVYFFVSDLVSLYFSHLMLSFQVMVFIAKLCEICDQVRSALSHSSCDRV